MIAEGN